MQSPTRPWQTLHEVATEFLVQAHAKSSPNAGVIEVEAALGLSADCGREHWTVEYRHFYRCFARLSELPGIKISKIVKTTDRCFANGLRQRVNAVGQSNWIVKSRAMKPAVVRLDNLWPHAALKLRASTEKAAAPDDSSEPTLERTKVRRSVRLSAGPLWRVDFTRVAQGCFFQHEIEIELDLVAVKAVGGASTIELVRQLRDVVEVLTICMNKA